MADCRQLPAGRPAGQLEGYAERAGSNVRHGRRPESWSAARAPTSAYFASSDNSVQVEVYDPSPQAGDEPRPLGRRSSPPAEPALRRGPDEPLRRLGGLPAGSARALRRGGAARSTCSAGDGCPARSSPPPASPRSSLSAVHDLGQRPGAADRARWSFSGGARRRALAALALRPARPVAGSPSRVGVFRVFGAPVDLSGEPTFAGYIKLDDTATWLAMTDRVMEHGREPRRARTLQLLRDPASTTSPGGYPIGAFVPFGAAQKLAGGDLAWVFQPYLSFLAAMLSLCLWEILRVPSCAAPAARRRRLPRRPAGAALRLRDVGRDEGAGLPSCSRSPPALAPAAARGGARRADAVLLALAAARPGRRAQPGGLVWVGPLLLALGLLALAPFGPRAALARRSPLPRRCSPSSCRPCSPAASTRPVRADQRSGVGNLSRPLNGFQAVGIWPSGDFRVAPRPACSPRSSSPWPCSPR